MKRLRLFLANVGYRRINMPSATPPLGLLSLAAYLRERFDLEIRLVDQRAENWPLDRLVREGVAFEADVVGFAALTSFAQTLEETARRFRAALPDALILLGGAHASAFGSEALERIDADALVVGEGEPAFEQVLSAYLDGADLGGIPGLVWRDASGEVVINPGRMPLIEDLDALPFPAYDLLNLDKYATVPRMSQLPPRKYVSLFTSRGCPYQCTYCHRVFGKRLRLQSAERIVDEVEHLVRTYGIEEVEFIDDVFNLDTGRIFEFSRLVNQRGLKLRIDFPNALRADLLTAETIDALVDAGMYRSSFALESGSPRVQKLIRKNLGIPRFLESVEMAVARGVFAHGFTMLGFPTETEEELRTTIDVACESQLHTATFFTVIPYPNTELYAHVMETRPEILAKLKYEDTDYTGISVNLSDVPDAVLFSLQRRAWRRFYMKPRRIARILRDYPSVWHLPSYIPLYSLRLAKGLIKRGSHV